MLFFQNSRALLSVPFHGAPRNSKADGWGGQGARSYGLNRSEDLKSLRWVSPKKGRGAEQLIALMPRFIYAAIFLMVDIRLRRSVLHRV